MPKKVAESTESLFEGIVEVPTEEEVAVATRPDDGIPALDTDLTESERDEFVRLLNKAIPLQERATRLAALARMKGSKTAGVGLRALQEINALTGLHTEGPTQAPPLFAFPEGTKIAVNVTKTVK